MTFSEVTGAAAGTAVLRLGMSDTPPTAEGYQPDASAPGGDAWFNNSSGDYDNPVLGNYAWTTVLHEIGHTLGLMHPHESEPPMPLDRDFLAYTVMSYRSYQGAPTDGYTNDTWGFSQTYMMEDIASLQYLYGANYNFHSANDTYTWSPTTGQMSINGAAQAMPGGNSILGTIWDGGGNDTYDFSNYSSGVIVDLQPGGWSTLSSSQLAHTGGGAPPGNVANALLYNNDARSLIENAIGTSGDDVITGNQAANHLVGGAGGDTLFGLAGNDVLDGGAGYNVLHGNDGNDTLNGGIDGESLYGDVGNDTIYGNLGDDYMEGGDGADHMEGGGGNDHVDGGSGDDTLLGGANDDVLDGWAGIDHIEGGDGNDTLYGGAENDTLIGGAGNDYLISTDGGTDYMVGGTGDDTYAVDSPADQIVEVVGEGTDTVNSQFDYVLPSAIENGILSGAPNGSTLTGNELNNYLSGSAYNNILIGGAGADVMMGYQGDDTFYVDNPGDVVYDFTQDFNYEQGGVDTIYASVSYSLIDAGEIPPNFDPYFGFTLGEHDFPGVENLILTGSGNLNGRGNFLANTLEGNAGNNVLDGRDGGDTLIGGAGADILTGGLGADVFDFTAVTDSMTGAIDLITDLLEGVDKIDVQAIQTTDFSFHTFNPGAANQYVEVTIAALDGTMVLDVAGTVALSDFDYTLRSVVGQTIIGTSGNDVLQGTAGNDVIDGAAGNDTMSGAAGSDVYFVDSVGDVINELANGGYDTVFTGVSYTLGNEIERLVTLDPASTAALSLTGNGSANEISGNAGANVIDGRGGADLMVGAGGNDTYYVDNAGDVVSEASGGGFDTIYTDVSFAIASSVERLAVRDSASTTSINLTGNASANELIGNAGANQLDGNGGADTMTGLGGNDIYFVDNAGDQVIEGSSAGYDTVFSQVDYTLGANVERVVAFDPSSAAPLHFTGNALANEITATAGGNLIDGKGGADVLAGGSGSDAFAFTTALGSGNVDALLDFQSGTDRIYLDHTVFGGLAQGTLSSDNFHIGSAAADANDLIIYDQAKGALLYDADGSGAGAAILFANVHDGLNLAASDFAVV
jgi:serralysin